MSNVVKAARVGRPKTFETNEVLDRAIEAFASRGYEATSIQDLVESMAINRYSIYEEFGDKHGLFLAALDRYHSVRRARIANHFLGLGPKIDLLRTHFRRIHVDAKSGGVYGCMMVNSAVELARNDPEIARRISEHYDLLEDIFAEVLRDAETLGEVKLAWPPSAVARFLLNVSRGLRVMVTYDKDEEVFDDIVKIALSVIN